MQVFHKEIDDQGRVLLPREWRKGLKQKKVIVIVEDKSVKILPETKKLTSFFAKAKPSKLKLDPFEDYEQSLAEASLR